MRKMIRLNISKEENKENDQIIEDEKMKANVVQNVHKAKNGFNKVLKRKTQKKKSRVPDNVNMIHPGHENFNQVFNIMLGVKKAVDAVLDVPLLEIQEKDFKIKCVYEIAPWRSSDDESLKACRFFDYAPQVFESIRKKFGIRRDQYSRSLGPEQILSYMLQGQFNSLAELCSSGKSGSFFYYTADGKYMLKTVSRTEFKFFKTIL